MDDNSTSNSQTATGNDDVYEAHCNMLSSSSISSQSGEVKEDEDDTREDFNTNTVDSSKSVLDPAVMDDTARDTLISFPTMNNNSNSKQSADADAENSDEGEYNNDDDGEDAGEIISAQASDDGELMSDSESRNKKDESEGELKSSEDERSDDEDLEEGEEGEVVERRRKKKPETNNLKSKKEEDLEEGEVSEEDNLKPKSVCRFFGKGQCTWGNSCRFLHPGVTDKGFYSMFDRPALLPHPTVPPHTPMAQGGPPSAMYPKPGLLGHAPPNYPPLGMGKPIPPSPDMLPIPVAPVIPQVPESAWERGLRNAKEMLKQSAARKETDIDFEDKKMNQSLNEDLDKENETDYYINARKAGDDLDHERDIMHRREFDPTNLDVSRERMNHRLEVSKRREAPPRDMNEEMLGRRKRREAPPLIGDEKPPRFPPPGRVGAEEWHDPWMRSSSYHRRPPPRRSRSGSFSSESDRRRHPSSGNESSPSRNKRLRKAPPRNLSPKPMRIAPPKEEPFERAPSGGRLDRVPIKRRISRSRSRSSSRSSSSSASSVSTGAAKKRRDSWSSSSSSASKSSGSSAYRRRGGPAKKRHVGRQISPPIKTSPPPAIPPVRQQPAVPGRQAPPRQAPPPDKKRAQIKMTLKEPSGKVKVNKNVLDKLSDEIMGKDGSDDDDDNDSLHSQPQSPVETKPVAKKKAPGRREELLKQLKAVEDAIAKKRSKIP